MNNFIQSKTTSSGYGYKANVLSHLSWISWIIIPSSFSCLIFSHDYLIKIFCMTIILGLIIYNLVKYEYWSKKDPDRLQTEKFILEKRRMDIYASKGELPQEMLPSNNTTPMLIEKHEKGEENE